MASRLARPLLARAALHSTAPRLRPEPPAPAAPVAPVALTAGGGTSKDVAIAPPTDAPAALWKTELGHISGQPSKQASRHVHIYMPAKTAMQSGTYQTRYWKIVFDSEDRWENSMMGWASSADPLHAVDLALRFKSKEAAVQFAEKNGWDYTLTEPQRRAVAVKRMYADNFKYVPGQLRFVKTK